MAADSGAVEPELCGLKWWVFIADITAFHFGFSLADATMVGLTIATRLKDAEYVGSLSQLPLSNSILSTLTAATNR